ncbi:MAG: hypothetical protein WBL69_08740 [Limnochordia bacterium]
MAEIYNNQISIAFDVYGCPQRCKHCLLVHPKHAAIDADEVISTFARIKHEHNQNRHYGSEVQYLSVDFRQPHYGDDYQELYQKVDAINGCVLEVERSYNLIRFRF